MSKNNAQKHELLSLISNKDLNTVFQPIFDITNKSILGYEALTRGPKDSYYTSPLTLFESAYNFGLLSLLERQCRRLAIERFAQQKLSGKLFLNISPLVLAQSDHPKGETLALLAKNGLSPKRVVIEVTEVFDGGDSELLKLSLEHYRKLGFKIAIDDLGTGHSGLKQWAELRPDIVKIDKYFIRDCHSNIVKRELLRTIFQLGKSMGVKIIAEGIETQDEYFLLEKIGMELAQGFLLGRPQKKASVNIPSLIKLDQDTLTAPKESLATEINELISPVSALPLNKKCIDVYQDFNTQPNAEALAVVDDEEVPVGMIYRQHLAELFSGEYGHALYDKKPISTVMEPLPFVVNVHSSLVDVSKRLTKNESLGLNSEFVVVEGKRYKGLVNVRVLLKKMTEERIKDAQHANPLTLLPGNVVIEKEISKRLQSMQPFRLAYFDLNYFKPFNDLYGYATGDNVIKLVADVLTSYDKSDGVFVGHIGGDDFVVIFTQDNWQSQCENMLSQFKDRLMQYFKSEHIENGGYYSSNREGERKFFPLLSISCGVVKPDLTFCKSHLDVASLASDAKKSAKKLSGNSMYICPRKSPLDHCYEADPHSLLSCSAVYS